jgi:hypothetical protein
MVKREDNGEFSTKVFRKPTHSDRYLHFCSDHPFQQKIAAVHTLKHRAYAYCSNAAFLESELKHLESTFISNGYPASLVHDLLFCPPNSPTKPQNAVTVQKSVFQLDEPEEKIGCLVVPYIPELHRQLTTLCKTVGVYLLYSRKTNLGNLISPHRPKSTLVDTRACIYEIPCKDCDRVYIGETKRKLGTRCKEHAASCVNALKNGRVSNSDKYDSGLPKHAFQLRHSFAFDQAKVLKVETHPIRRKYLEAIEILKCQKTVNVSDGRTIDRNWAHVIDMFLNGKDNSGNGELDTG